MAKQLKRWQGWLLFGGSMVVVFILGLLVSSLLERRAEVVSIFNNRKVQMEGIVADNAKFEGDFPREYETWRQTADTTFKSEFNSSAAVDVLAQRPNMVVLWGVMLFRGNIIHHAATIMQWKTCVLFCEQELRA